MHLPRLDADGGSLSSRLYPALPTCLFFIHLHLTFARVGTCPSKVMPWERHPQCNRVWLVMGDSIRRALLAECGSVIARLRLF